jgi:hypothetical protein
VSGIGDYFGGLVGDNFNSSIANSYATGVVDGTGDYVGGLVGDNFNSIIVNSYATGVVDGTGDYFGGLVGDNYNSTTTNSFWNQENNNSLAGCGHDTGTTCASSAIGKTTTQMKVQGTYTPSGTYDANTCTGSITTGCLWDFTNVWNLNTSMNSGYPYLRGVGGQ